jgi:hypothetical protein
MWASEKLRALPAWAKAEFAWLLPLAMANGVFECDIRRIWAKCYVYCRPEMSIEQLMEVFHAFVQVGLLFRWREACGKEWGYWVGISKIGRLPPKSRLYRKHETCGPEPPRKQLAEFMASHYVADGLIGLGLGLGLGQVSQDHMLCNKSSIQPTKKAPQNGHFSTDDLKKLFLEKMKDPNRAVVAAVDIIISRAEASGVKIRSTQYLETALSNFNFQTGKDHEEIQQLLHTPL